jgi:diguanylate cyclase (GGDEF)-like protein
VALPGTDLAGAEQLAERVRATVGARAIALVRGDGEPLRVSVSLGVAAVRGKVATADGLMAAADTALYAAKRAGRNATVAAR